MNYEVIDIAEKTIEQIVKILKIKYMYKQNDTVFITQGGKYLRRINYEIFNDFYPNHVKEMLECKEEQGDKFSYSFTLNEYGELKNIFFNKEYSPKTNFFMDKNRWDMLYKNNNEVIDFINEKEINKIVTTGDFGEYIYYYIRKYGTNIEVEYIPNEKFLEIDENYVGYVVIDATGESSDFRSKLISNNQYYSLLDFCDMVEINTFNKKVLSGHQDNFIFLEFPTQLNKYTGLSDEEVSRFNKPFKKPYRYKDYLKNDNPIIKQLVKQFYGNYYDEQLIRDVCYPSQVMIINGLLCQKDIINHNFHILNGKRIIPFDNNNGSIEISFYGNCLVYGQMVSDNCTIPSYFQQKLKDKSNYKVYNYGMPKNSLTEIIRTINKKGILDNSMNIIFYLDSEKNILDKINLKFKYDLTSLLNSAMEETTFLDSPLHCNQQVNQVISQFVYDRVINRIKAISKNSGKKIVPFLYKDLYTNNKYAMAYAKFLKKFKREGTNGAIVLNGNPFTKGHLGLIEYASKIVDNVYVFILQEERSIFRFKDRYSMAYKSCEGLENVIVLPSGEFLGSTMIFPEYGMKNSSENIRVDCVDDVEYFCDVISPILNIKKRFVGNEDYDMITSKMNEELKKTLPKYDMQCVEIPRFTADNQRISAYMVRKLIVEEKFDELEKFLPKPVIEIIYDNDYLKIIRESASGQLKNYNSKQKQMKFGAIK